ncbi:MAG TPA: serine/threonine-protein kinase, partial [Gemmataceae bacterium]|nr:serine/threonine-protein kinase [Gemmataceae bacterium]
MPEHPDRDSTTAPLTPCSPQNELTRSYVPSQADEGEESASERATQPRRTGGKPEAFGQSSKDALLTSVGGYAILGEIGRGGMGVVLEADDPQLSRHLAVKVLQEQYQHDPTLVRRFLDEARICGQLQHPGIVPIHEIGRLPDQRPFFTMKLIQGQTLAALLQARGNPADDLPRFLTMFEQICQTMAYAHAHGIIHRDLKPSNIMAGSFGEVQVMDWGLAKVLTPVGWADEGGPPCSSGG